MAEASPTMYADAFERGKPGVVYTSVTDRFDTLQRYTEEIAQYMHERAQLEEQYVKSLQKLSAKHAFTAQIEGGWKLLRSTLTNEIGEMARVHEQWRSKVAQEVEQAMRKSLNSGSWNRYLQNEARLSQDVKEYEQALEKVQKAQSKGKASSKLMEAQSKLSASHTSVTQAMPAWLSTAQELDVSHSAALKEALVRYGTISSDLGRERMEAGERVLNAVLAIDDQAEMQEWALKEGRKAGGGRIGGETLQSNGQSAVAPPPSVAPPTAASLTPARPVVSRTESQSRNAPPPAQSIPVPSPVIDRTASNKQGGSGFKLGGFLSSSSKNRDRSSSIQSGSRYGSLDPDARSIDSRSTGRNNAQDDAASTKKKKRDSIMPFGGGSLFKKSNKNESSSTQRQRIDEDEPVPTSGGTAAQVDSEGYTVKPEGYDRRPWDQSHNLLDDDDDEPAARAAMPPPVLPETSRAHEAPSAPAVAIAPSAPIVTESTEDREAALNKVKSTLLGSKPGDGSPASSSLNRRNTRRREVPASRGMSIDSMGGDGSFPSSPRLPSAAIAAGGAGVVAGGAVGAGAFSSGSGNGRTSSILSSGSSVHNADPFASATDEEGVTVSETINAVLQGNSISKLLITGSVTVARPTSTRLLLTNAESIEKSVPNAHFASSLSASELSLLPALSEKKATVLKYQLRSSDSLVPFRAEAKWSCAEGLTRLIIEYELTNDDEGDELEELTLTVPISVPIVEFQTKPSAAATKSESGDKLVFVLDGAATRGRKGKLLASVKTTGLGAPKPIAVSFRRSRTVVQAQLDGSESRGEFKTGKFVLL